MKTKLANQFNEIMNSSELNELINRDLLVSVLQQFEVIDPQLNFRIQFEQGEISTLLPREFDGSFFSELISKVGESAEENTYLASFLNELSKEDWSQITCCLGESRFQQYQALATLLTFAYALEKINTLANLSPENLRVLVTHYQRIRKEKNYYRLGNLLGMIKLHSIELPLVRFLKAHKKRKMGASFAKFLLSFNIFEALLVDLATGFWDNAKVAWTLIKFPPNFKAFFFRSFKKGAGSRFSDDNYFLELSPPNPREWADLYQVWNMAFVSQFEGALFLLVKLFIPSVAGYNERPQQYMHRRITAMHFAMHFLDFTNHHSYLPININKTSALSKELTKKWTKHNREAARKYECLNRDRS